MQYVPSACSRPRAAVRRLVTVAAVGAAVATATAAPAQAGHDHFVHIEKLGVCQYVAHGQTAIDDPDHGGHHRFHGNVHTGQPGTDDRGNTFDKDANEGTYDCEARGRR